MEFKKYTVEELVKLDMLEKPMDGNHGSKHPTSKDYVEEGIPFVMVSDINNGKINYKTCKYISKETRNNLDKGFAKPNDVLLSHKATVGLTAIVGDEFEEIVLTPQLTYYRVKNNINNKYLKYYFDSPYFQNILKNWATSGSTRAYLGIKAQLKLPILLPDINNQNKIADILSMIDKKIELNNKMNDNLSEQLQIYFEEKINKYKNNELPFGWRMLKLKEIANFSQGVQVPVELQSEQMDKEHTIRFIRIVDITQGNSKDIRYIEDKKRGYILENEIFMIRYGTPGILSRNYRGIIANNLFKISPKQYVTNEYLYSALNSTDIQNYITQNATSSTMPAISFGTLNNQEILVADDKAIIEFSQYSDLIRKKQLNIIKENETLEKIRDTLLPKLMNGEIDLNNI